MKRLLAFFLAAALLLSLAPCALGDDTPNPIPVLEKNEIDPTPKGMHHYMLICMDSWKTALNNLSFTDGLVLVTVDEIAQRVMLTSFIRDMLVYRPHVPDDHGQNAADYTPGEIQQTRTFGRINYIAQKIGNAKKGGQRLYTPQQAFQTLIDTINDHFNLQIEKYIVVNFQQVQNIIDAIGGVDIEITSREASYLKNYSLSPASTTPALSGGGVYHFSGHAAVIYMRIRKVANIEGETQDVGRTRRARIVLTNIADSLKNITYDEASRLLDVVVGNTVFTNMSANDMLDALDLAMRLKGTRLEGIRMPVDGTYSPCAIAGMATQQIDYLANREALWDFLLDSFVVVDEEGADEW